MSEERERWIKERITQAQEDESGEFHRQVEAFELEARRKDDKAKMDTTRNCKKQLAQPRGPLFDDKQKEMF